MKEKEEVNSQTESVERNSVDSLSEKPVGGCSTEVSPETPVNPVTETADKTETEVSENGSDGGKPKKKRKWLKYVLSAMFLVAMVVVTGFFLFKGEELSDIFAVMKTADYRFIALAVLCVVIYVFFEGLVLFAMVRTHGDKTNIFKNIKYAAADYYFCGITPSASGGQPVVGMFMLKDGISGAFSTIVLLLSTAMFKIVLVIFGLISLCIIPELIFSNALIAILFVLGIVANVAMVAVCLLLVFKQKVIAKSGRKILDFLHKIKLIKNIDKVNDKFEKMLVNYKEGSAFVKSHIGLSCRMMLYTVIQRLALFSVGFVVSVALGAEGMNYFQFVAVQVVIAVSVDALPFPGGVGLSEKLLYSLYEVVYCGALANLMMPALLLTRGISFYLLLTLTGVGLLIYSVVRAVVSYVKNKKNSSV